MAGEGLGGPSSKLPNMTMSAPTTAVARGPNLSSRMPRGSLHSAFPAMPIVATVFISDDLQQAPTGLQGEPGLRLRERALEVHLVWIVRLVAMLRSPHPPYQLQKGLNSSILIRILLQNERPRLLSKALPDEGSFPGTVAEAGGQGHLVGVVVSSYASKRPESRSTGRSAVQP